MIFKHKHLKLMCAQEFLEKLRKSHTVHLTLDVQLKPLSELKRILGDSLEIPYSTNPEMKYIMERENRCIIPLQCTIYSSEGYNKIEYKGYNWTADCFYITSEEDTKALKDFT